MKDLILLKKRNKVLVPKSDNTSQASLQLIAAAVRNIESLGYTLSTNVVDNLKCLSNKQVELFYNSLIKNLKVLRGANVKFTPMYPNFPQQVMDMSEAELYTNAKIHYTGDAIGYRIMPQYDTLSREALSLFDEQPLEVLSVGEKEDVFNIFSSMLKSNSSLSPEDKGFIEWMVVNESSDMKKYVPDSIPFKENLTYFISLVLQNNINPGSIFNLIKTPTDVLRLITALSGGDISLSENTKYINFTRKHRRFFLSLINSSCGGNHQSIAEDMMRHKNKWLRVGEKLHPGQYGNNYTAASIAFGLIRKDKVETFNSFIEKCLLNNNVNNRKELLKSLSSRPGDFARRLDHVLRTASSTKHLNNTLSAFEKVADKVASPILLNLISHFNNRLNAEDTRVFFPKGNTAKAFTIKNELKALSKNTVTKINNICYNSLVNELKTKSFLGKVFIDPVLSEYVVPLKQRNASTSSKTIARGSNLSLDKNKDVIRFFLWWKNEENGNRVDIDLSAMIYDDNWKYKEHVSYTNLKSSTYKAAHSGDITSAPNGACEFIDIDLNSVYKSGGRYIVPVVCSFTGQQFSSLPECFAGWMMRTSVGKQTGEIFEAKTVVNKFDVESSSTVSVPAIIDCRDKKSLWMDLALTKRPTFSNVENTQTGILSLCKSMTNNNLPNLYTLFMLNAKARGTLVSKREEADIVFALDGDVTPFDAALITSEYL